MAFPSTGPGLTTQILASTGLLRVSDAAVAVHPTQVYELIAALGCAAIALRLRRRGAAPGVPVLAFAAAFLLFRAGNQALRVPPPAATLPDLLPLVADNRSAPDDSGSRPGTRLTSSFPGVAPRRCAL